MSNLTTNDRRVTQLRDIFTFMRAMCRNSPDMDTFRKNLARMANPDDASEQRNAAATMFTGLWQQPVSPAELFLDFEALNTIFRSEERLNPLKFLRAMENAPDDALAAYDRVRHKPPLVYKLYQSLSGV